MSVFFAVDHIGIVVSSNQNMLRAGSPLRKSEPTPNYKGEYQSADANYTYKDNKIIQFNSTNITLTVCIVVRFPTYFSCFLASYDQFC